MNLGGSYGWTPVERFKDVRQLGGRNSQSFVFDADLDLLASIAFAQAGANADPAVRAAVDSWDRKLLNKQIKATRRVFLEVYA